MFHKINPTLNNYCLSSTTKSMKKLVEKLNKERLCKNLEVSKPEDPEQNNNKLIFSVICIMSISSIIYYYYKFDIQIRKYK